MEGITQLIKRGLLDRPRQLTISPEYFEFENKDLRNDLFTRFESNTIRDYRFGIRWIRGFEFTVGREYLLYIRNEDLQIIKISFKSFYGIKKNTFNTLYDDIIKYTWEFYFGNIANTLINKFRDGENIEICNVQIAREAVTINTGGVFKGQAKAIPWDQVATKDYYTYFAIYSTEDSAKINKGFKYLDDWNVGILYCVMKTILHYKQAIETNEIKN